MCGFPCELIQYKIYLRLLIKDFLQKCVATFNGFILYCHELQCENRPKGRPFELPRYSYDVSRTSFVLTCLYECKSFLVHCFSTVFFVLLILLLFFGVFLCVRFYV